MKQTIRRLPDAELEVMQALWDCETPAARADLETLLAERHPMATTTLLTQLTRLREKGFLTIEKAGRRSLYTPLISRQEYLAARSGSFVRRVCGGSISVFAAALCDSGLTREELDELRRALEEGSL